MRHAAVASTVALAFAFGAALLTQPGATPASAQNSEAPAADEAAYDDVYRTFDVLSAVEGVWAYDMSEVDEPGDFTCGARPMALMAVDGGARIASKRAGDEAARYGLVLDVRNDFPLGPALSIIWEDAPLNTLGEPIASVLVMDGADSFSWISGESLKAYQSGASGLERSPMRARCAT